MKDTLESHLQRNIDAKAGTIQHLEIQITLLEETIQQMQRIIDANEETINFLKKNIAKTLLISWKEP